MWDETKSKRWHVAHLTHPTPTPAPTQAPHTHPPTRTLPGCTPSRRRSTSAAPTGLLPRSTPSPSTYTKSFFSRVSPAAAACVCVVVGRGAWGCTHQVGVRTEGLSAAQRSLPSLPSSDLALCTSSGPGRARAEPPAPAAAAACKRGGGWGGQAGGVGVRGLVGAACRCVASVGLVARPPTLHPSPTPPPTHPPDQVASLHLFLGVAPNRTPLAPPHAPSTTRGSHVCVGGRRGGGARRCGHADARERGARPMQAARRAGAACKERAAPQQRHAERLHRHGLVILQARLGGQVAQVSPARAGR